MFNNRLATIINCAQAAVDLEVVFKKRNITFKPQAKATRPDAAVMLRRALKKLVSFFF